MRSLPALTGAVLLLCATDALAICGAFPDGITEPLQAVDVNGGKFILDTYSGVLLRCTGPNDVPIKVTLPMDPGSDRRKNFSINGVARGGDNQRWLFYFDNRKGFVHASYEEIGKETIGLTWKRIIPAP